MRWALLAGAISLGLTEKMARAAFCPSTFVFLSGIFLEEGREGRNSLQECRLIPTGECHRGVPTNRTAAVLHQARRTSSPPAGSAKGRAWRNWGSVPKASSSKEHPILTASLQHITVSPFHFSQLNCWAITIVAAP